MKKLSETYKELGIAFSFPIEIKDANGYATYFETRRHWQRYERGANGNLTYYEDSDGYKKSTPRSSKTCDGKVVVVDGTKYKLQAL